MIRPLYTSVMQYAMSMASSSVLESVPGAQFGYGILSHFSPNSKQIVEYDGGDVTIIPSRSPCENDLYWRGEFEPTIRDVIHEGLSRGDVAIDIGAHVGHHTVSMHQSVGDSGRVLSIEPDPDRASVLRETASKLGNASVLECGVSDAKKEGHLSGDIPEVSNSGTAVSLTTLDNIIEDHDLESVDLIKMDIEGHEIEALEGLDKSFDRVKSLIIEVHTNRIDDGGLTELIDTLANFSSVRRIDTGDHVSDLEETVRESSPVHLYCVQ